MKGSEILKDFPEKRSGVKPQQSCFEAREQMVLDHVRAGNYVLEWEPIEVKHGNLTATYWVSKDALRLGEPGDSFRASVTACTQQKVADELDVALMTPKLLDEVWNQAAIRLDPPVTLGSKVPMTTTSRMVHHHNEVEKRAEKAANELFGSEVDLSQLLISNVGKHWVIDRRLLQNAKKHGQPQSINYGWWLSNKFAKGSPAAKRRPVTGIPGVNIWQTPGGAHNIYHQDYSQVMRFVARTVMVCAPVGAFPPAPPVAGLGQPTFEGKHTCLSGESCRLEDGSLGVSHCVDIYDLGQDPSLAALVSHNGPVYMRYESVPYEPGTKPNSLFGGLKHPPPPNRIKGGAPPPPRPPAPGPECPPGEVMAGGRCVPAQAPPVPPLPPGPVPPTLVAGMGAAPKVGAIVVGAAVGWYAWGAFKGRR